MENLLNISADIAEDEALMKKLFISQTVAGAIFIIIAGLRLINPAFLETFDTIDVYKRQVLISAMPSAPPVEIDW